MKEEPRCGGPCPVPPSPLRRAGTARHNRFTAFSSEPGVGRHLLCGGWPDFSQGNSPMQPPAESTTALLRLAGRGDVEATTRLYERLLSRLRGLVQRRLEKYPPAVGLERTGVVNEAFMKLMQNEQEWKGT